MPGKKTNQDGVVIPDAQSVFHNPDGTSSMVLDDVYDPNYNPSSDELVDYALWLGMEPDSDEGLMWIAKEGLKAPLPEHWRPCKTDSNEVYYFNFQTGDSMWDHPLDTKIKELYKRENDKRQAGKPYKKAMDDEVRIFLHGSTKAAHKAEANRAAQAKADKSDVGGGMGLGRDTKKKKKDDGGKAPKAGKKKKEADTGLPAALTTALVTATDKLSKTGGKKSLMKDSVDDGNDLFSPPTRAKGGKFNALPTGGKLGGLSSLGSAGGLGGTGNGGGLGALGGLGGPSKDVDVEVVKPGALGRRALPGLGADDPPPSLRGKPSALEAVGGRGMSTPGSATLKSPAFDTVSNAESVAHLTQVKQDMVDSLNRELERLKEEHRRITEDDESQHERAQKRMRNECEQELQDMETELTQKMNRMRRTNTAEQAKWEQSLEEQNKDSRRRFEKELQEEFASWKESKDAALASKKGRLEAEQDDALADLKAKKKREAEQLAREHEDELDAKRAAWQAKKQAVEQRKKELDERRRHVESKKSELAERERQVQADRRAVEAQQAAHEQAKKDLSTSAGDRTKNADAIQAANDGELAAVKAAQAEKIESLRNATAGELDTVRSQQAQDLQALKERHKEDEARAKREWEAKHADLQRAVDDLESELASRRAVLGDMQKSVDVEREDLAACTFEASARAQSAMSTVSEELEEAMHAIRQRHAEEKARMERQLAEEEEEIRAEKAALVAKMEVDLEEEAAAMKKSQADAARAARAEAELQRQEQLAALRKRVESEQNTKYDELVRECNERKQAEEARLEKEMGDELERVMADHRDKIGSFKAEQEQRIQQEMSRLRASSEQERAAQLERMTAEQMTLAQEEAKHRLEEKRAARQRRLEDTLRQMEAEAKEQETKERRRIEQRVQERIAEFEKRQALTLKAAAAKEDEKAAALVQARRELEDELCEVRDSCEKELDSVITAFQRGQFTKRTEAESKHQEEVERLQCEQDAQLAEQRAAHAAAMRELEVREQEAIRDFNATTPLIEERAQLLSSQEAELQRTKEAHGRALAEAQETFTQTIEALKATHAAELVAAKDRALAEAKKVRAAQQTRTRPHTLDDITPAPSEDPANGLVELHPLTNLAAKISCASPSPRRSHRTRYSHKHDHRAGKDPYRHHHRHGGKTAAALRDQEALLQAKAAIKQKKRSLRKRMAELDGLRHKWEEDMAELKRSGGGDVAVLAKAKDMLNMEAERLNAESREVSGREYWLRERMMKMKKCDEWLDGRSESDCSDCTSLTPMRPSGRRRRGGEGYAYPPSSRGARDDPRVLMLLNTLAKNVITLSAKVTHLEERPPKEPRHDRHRSHRHRDPMDAWAYDYDVSHLARQMW